jgi:hypothetical protein
MFKAICKLGLEGIVSKKLDAPYKSGPSKVAENQKSECTSCNSGDRWNVFMMVPLKVGGHARSQGHDLD